MKLEISNTQTAEEISVFLVSCRAQSRHIWKGFSYSAMATAAVTSVKLASARKGEKGHGGEKAKMDTQMEVKWKWQTEKEQFNAVIKFLIATWKMCFGLTPGQLIIPPRLFKPHAYIRVTQYAHTHYLNKRNYVFSVISSHFWILEHVSFTEWCIDKNRHKGAGEVAARMHHSPSFSLTHWRARNASTSAHISQQREHKWTNDCSFLCFSVYNSSILPPFRCFIECQPFLFLVFLWQYGSIQFNTLIQRWPASVHEFDKKANVVSSCTDGGTIRKILISRAVQWKGAHWGEREWERERERDGEEEADASIQPFSPSPTAQFIWQAGRQDELKDFLYRG